MKSKNILKISAIKKGLIKITALYLIIVLNWAGLSAIGNTFAYFNDIEDAALNRFESSSLDFSLGSPADFSPDVTPTATSTREINVINDGLLGFDYTIQTANATSTLCDNLNLIASLRGEELYNGPLMNFNYNTGEFSATSTNDWQFKANLINENASFQNQTCQFDFVFDGAQIGGAGFSDREIISNTINSGEWLKLVINKVYYNVDNDHGTEANNEWIELYNPTDQDINLKDWKICDNTECAIINSNSTITALGYAMVSHDASTWNYWEIPGNVVKIHQLGGGDILLNNTADMLLLKNTDGSIVDQMNWGAPTSTWANYNPDLNLWNPGATTTPDGHMLGRVPSGYDTDQVSDWKDLGLPNVDVTYPNGGETWWVGRIHPIQWIALNPNGPDNVLSIDIYYSKDSGATWANIVKGEANDRLYDWRVPLCLDDGNGGCYYTASSKARIKVVAYGPENFMVQDWDMSDSDFCPPIDYDLLTPEEKAILEQMNLEENPPAESPEITEDINLEQTQEQAPAEENFVENTTTAEIIIEENTTENTTTTEEIITENVVTVEEILPTDNVDIQMPAEDQPQDLILEQPATVKEQAVIVPDDSADDNAGDGDGNGNNINNNETENIETVITDSIQAPASE